MRITSLLKIVALAVVAACSSDSSDSSNEMLSLVTTPESPLQQQKPKPKKQEDGFVQVLPTTASALVIGAGDASPWIVRTDSTLAHYNNDYPAAPYPNIARAFIQQMGCSPSSTTATSVAVSPEGTPWKVDQAGSIWKHTGTAPYENICSWGLMGTLSAYEVGVGKNDAAWAIGSVGCDADYNCPIYQWNSGSLSWVPTGYTGSHIAVSPDGASVYATNGTSGSITKWDGSSFQPFTGGGCVNHAADVPGWPVLAAGPNDELWDIGCTTGTGGNVVEYYSKIDNVWTQTSNAAVTISVSADGTPWVVDSNQTIWEYVTEWVAVGPNGFSFTQNNVTTQLSGEIHDIDVASRNGRVTIGARAGGVWQYLTNLGYWYSAGDVGAGVGFQGTQWQAPPAPMNAVESVTAKPANSDIVIVGTGVASRANGFAQFGNGLWWTSCVSCSTVFWNPSNVAGTFPASVVKVRYSANGAYVYAISPTNLYVSQDDGAHFTMKSCTPQSTHQFTDLVVDPHDATIAYVGVTGEGVYQVTGGGAACNPGQPPPLMTPPTSSITAVALAMTSSSVLYAAIAGTANGYGCDFQNIDATSTAAWTTPSPWTVATAASTMQGSSFGSLNSDLNRVWALGTNSTGSVVILGGVGLYRGTGCTPTNCTLSSVPIEITQPGHADHHAVRWQPNTSTVYVGNDGGIFKSTNDGATWTSLNSLNVSQTLSADVNGTNVFGASWDVGLFWSNGGPFQGGIVGDGAQAIADKNTTYGYFSFDYASSRFRWDGTNISNIDKPIATVTSKQPALLSKALHGDLFSTGIQWDAQS